MNEQLTFIKRIFSTVFAVVLAALTLTTDGIDLISQSRRSDISKTNIVGIDAYFHSQGMTTDGKTLFFSSKTTLIQTTDDAQTVIKANYRAIPAELSEKYAIKHIGGLSYYNGSVYAAIEDGPDYLNSFIALYDAETLEFTGKYYELPPRASS